MESGIKPSIHAFSTVNRNVTAKEEQYKWIVKDILRKREIGVSLSNMVILARTNRSLSNIELEFIANKIPIVKQLGTALLDKYHVKDFLAFVIIINNPKSSIHWKRVISIHKGFNTIKANEIVEGTLNIYDKVVTLSYTNEHMNNLITTINIINGINKDNDKAIAILSYLEKLWLLKHKNVEELKDDILSLLYYLRNSSLTDFINDLYLNQEIESTYDNVLQLSTIHGSKGLEWEHVYILDVTNYDFPSIQNEYYTGELDTMEEERRLFYVACSRAKKFLTLTYYTDSRYAISPFIREIETDLYFSNNVINNKLLLENIIPRDVTSILRNYGYTNIADMFSNLSVKEKSIHGEFNMPKDIIKLKSKFIIGSFIDYLIPKMLQNNFNNKIKKFDLNIIHKNENFSKKIYHEYIDENNHWNNQLENIFYIASYNKEVNNLEKYKEFLLSNKEFYNNL